MIMMKSTLDIAVYYVNSYDPVNISFSSCMFNSFIRGVARGRGVASLARPAFPFFFVVTEPQRNR